MARVILEIDAQLYRLLKSAAETNHLSLEEECCRRLQGASAARVICKHWLRNCAPRMNSGALIQRDYFFFAGAALGQSESWKLAEPTERLVFTSVKS